jgi:hypothetical protein
MTFVLSHFCFVLRHLQDEERTTDLRIAAPLPDGLAGTMMEQAGLRVVDETTKKMMLSMLGFTEHFCKSLELDATARRIVRFKGRLEYDISPDDYRSESKILRETIEDEIKAVHCYYLTKESVALRSGLEKDWHKTFPAFPSAQVDIRSAVNCYATGNYTACVFHLMRVAEYGLRALARERKVSLPRGRPLEWGTWESILAQLDKKIDIIANKKAGPARGKALEFYRGILNQFAAFKDEYRNNVMHTRAHYDAHQAKGALMHVREFMERIAAKIDENPKKSLTWGLR